MKKKTNWAKTKRYLPLYLMLLPGAAYLIINNYLPMAGLVLAFKKVNYNVGSVPESWTGLSNFKYLFTTKDAFIFFRNTILYNLAFIFFGNLMGIITAVALDSIRKKFFNAVQSSNYSDSLLIVYCYHQLHCVCLLKWQ